MPWSSSERSPTVQSFVALGLALVVGLLGGCGANAGDDSPQRPPLTSGSPVTAFSPLILLHPREPAWPMSADYFIANSGLEWGGGPCRFEIDVAASPASRGAAAGSIPLLDVRRLGGDPPYRVRARDEECAERSVAYSTDERTRPFAREGRPTGLPTTEGFNLDILTDAQPGRRRLGRDGSLAGVPVYFQRQRVRSAQADLRITYWMLYGRGYVDDPARSDASYREGDWERVEALVRLAPGARREYELLEMRYPTTDGWRSRPWPDIELGGPNGTHPLVYASRGTHTPRLRRECDEECVRWRTWRLLRAAPREPWYGYGGAWGEVGDSEATSGPMGPTPSTADQ